MSDKLIFAELKEFVISYGGLIDDRLFVGIDPITRVRGLRASAPIPANTTLLRIPSECFLTGLSAVGKLISSLSKAPQNSIDDLALALNLVEARSQGPDSIFYAYIKVNRFLF